MIAPAAVFGFLQGSDAGRSKVRTPGSSEETGCEGHPAAPNRGEWGKEGPYERSQING